MKNYEKLINSYTIEKLVDSEVRLINVNNTNLLWITSTGQTFPYENKQAAIQYEYQYLMLDEDEMKEALNQNKEENNVVEFKPKEE